MFDVVTTSPQQTNKTQLYKVTFTDIWTPVFLKGLHDFILNYKCVCVCNLHMEINFITRHHFQVVGTQLVPMISLLFRGMLMTSITHLGF